uniref:Uncharacterized protein n=1 Tax=Anguilla anguilla TaxID=7936 RepID=A0A0E9VEY5_ANGAN
MDESFFNTNILHPLAMITYHSLAI